MSRKKKIRTPAQDFLVKCAANSITIDPQTKMVIRHLNMLDDAVRYIWKDFAAPYKGIPFVAKNMREKIYAAYEPLTAAIREEFSIYISDNFAPRNS